jgi:hypothetical protein
MVDLGLVFAPDGLERISAVPDRTGGWRRSIR